MWAFENRTLHRVLIYGFALLIVVGTLVYTNYIVRQLAEEERKTVKLKVNALQFVGASSDQENCEISFVYDHLIKTNELVPIIIADENATPMMDRNLNIPEDLPDAEYKERVKNRLSKMRQMKEGEKPISFEYYDGQYQYVYYDDSFLLKQLKFFPFMQLIIISIFIFILLLGFTVAKRNEQNKVWVGLAKETAHQLGTPISSLMAWLELLKLNLEDNPDEYELILEMEGDVQRLEGVAERFSKIGSEPEFTETDSRELLNQSAEYIRKRMSRSGKATLDVNNNIPPDSKILVSPQLFSWVIENLLKNALDALPGGQGKLTIDAVETNNKYYIDVSDTGKGIPKNRFDEVFQPGFTTKKRGWGLGLSLTKRIVENYHKGRIFVLKSEVGKGTTFRIILPKKQTRGKVIQS